MDSLATRTGLEIEIEKMKDFVAEVNKSNSQKRDCAKDKRDFIG